MSDEIDFVRLELSTLQKQQEHLREDMMLSEAFPGPLDEERREELRGVELLIGATQRKLDELLVI